MKTVIFSVLVLLLAACGDSVKDRATQLQTTAFTPAGAAIRAEAGITVSDDSKAAVDAGLTAVFAKAKCQGYTRGLIHRGFTISFLKGQQDSSGNPAIRIPCGSYCGTQWDKGGYILVAGQVVTSGGIQIIALPEYTGNNSGLARITEYEAEHIVLQLNDPEEYERTKIHGGGTGHPIIPDCKPP